MSAVENTSDRDPLLHLVGLLADGNDAYITGMEAAGQRQVVNSDVLPVDLHDPEEAFIALGFTFGPPVDGDPLFRRCTIPAGWQRRGTEHDMWSSIVDERGIERVSIFYKAAFYDRRAFVRLCHVGAMAANRAVYGDGEPRIEQWDLFTDAEKADARAELALYRKSAERSPQIYADRLPRLDAIERSLT